MTQDSLRATVLALPENHRAELAYEILQSLKIDNEIHEGSSEFALELERRSQSYKAGETLADDWDSAISRIRETIRNEHSS